MYNPSHFEESRQEVLHRLVVSHPLAVLVRLGEAGLVADSIPLFLDPSQGPQGCLLGHVARANPLWRDGSDGTEVLAVFQGPQHYVSPGWYPTKQEHGKVVPTWNYVVVQARGRLQVHDDAQWVRAQASRLTAQQERPMAAPWAVDDAPPAYTETMLKAVVGISIAVTQWTGKWKVSQNQVPPNQAGVVQALRQQASGSAQAMADCVAAAAEARQPPMPRP